MKFRVCRWLALLACSCMASTEANAQVTQERFAQTIPNVAAWTNESYAAGDPGCGACDCNSGNAQFCYNDTATDTSWLTATAMQDFSFDPAWEVTSVKVDIMCRYRIGTSGTVAWDFQVPGVRGWASAPFTKLFSTGDGNCRYRLGNFDITNLLGRPWTRADLDALQVRFRRQGDNTSRLQVRAFRVTVTAEPFCTANDECSGAFNAGVGTTYVDNTQSCVDGPESECDDPDNPASRDVWHKFIAPENRFYSIQVCSDAFVPMLSVYDGCGGPELGCDAGAGTDCLTNSSIVDIRARAGHEYMIRVAGVDGGAGASWIHITPGECVSANDVCADALDVGVGQTYVDNACSIDDGPWPSCDTDQASSMDVWYKFTPTQSGLYAMQICSDSFDTMLSVYSDSCSGPQIGCCDSDYGGCMTFSSTVSVHAWVGHQYYIRVASVSGDAGVAVLNIEPLAAPTNDLCDGATLIGQGQIRFNTAASELDGFEASCDDSFYPSMHDLWYRFVAPMCGFYKFSVCTNEFEPVISLYNACDEGDWACAQFEPGIDCEFESSLFIAAEAGQSILIRVAGSTRNPDLESFGTGILSVTMACPADFDFNDFVNGDDFDLFAWFFEFGVSEADINCDGFVNGDDFDLFAVHFDAGC